MSQYLLSVHHSDRSPVPDEADIPKMYAAVDAFNKEVMDAGKWVFAGGLTGIEDASVVDATGAESVVTDGPFSESKEYLGGFWVIEAADLDEARSWAERGSAACAGPVEVRPFQAEPS